MASALETRVRKLESRVVEIALRSTLHMNKPPYDWEAYNRALEEFYAEHPEWWQSVEWWESVGGRND